MIDLETLDTENTAVILSIAAVQFDPETGTIGETFHQNISVDSNLKAGCTISGSTLQFWLNQDLQLLKDRFNDPVNLHFALNRLNLFFTTHRLVYAWGNSARFDLGILLHAYKKCAIKAPWLYRNERCYRTIVGHFPLTNTARNTIAKEFKAHDPIDDCYKQIKLLKLVLDGMPPSSPQKKEE